MWFVWNRAPSSNYCGYHKIPIATSYRLSHDCFMSQQSYLPPMSLQYYIDGTPTVPQQYHITAVTPLTLFRRYTSHVRLAHPQQYNIPRDGDIFVISTQITIYTYSGRNVCHNATIKHGDHNSTTTTQSQQVVRAAVPRLTLKQVSHQESLESPPHRDVTLNMNVPMRGSGRATGATSWCQHLPGFITIFIAVVDVRGSGRHHYADVCCVLVSALLTAKPYTLEHVNTWQILWMFLHAGMLYSVSKVFSVLAVRMYFQGPQFKRNFVDPKKDCCLPQSRQTFPQLICIKVAYELHVLSQPIPLGPKTTSAKPSWRPTLCGIML